MVENEQGNTYLDPAEVQSGKTYAVLAYLGILVLIPIFAAKENRYARYHANQGLVLFLAEVVCSILSMLSFVPFASMIGSICGFVCFIFMILGLVNASKGVMKPLPLIGGITLIK